MTLKKIKYKNKVTFDYFEIWLGEEKQGETLLEILGTPRGSREENFR